MKKAGDKGYFDLCITNLENAKILLEIDFKSPDSEYLRDYINGQIRKVINNINSKIK